MKFLQTLRAVLREIFEESAYERYCRREGVSRGRDSYSRFLRQRDSKVNVKCC
jgi:hypothetical protein